MSNATLEQTEMRISPELMRFGELNGLTKEFRGFADRCGEKVIFIGRYASLRYDINEFEHELFQKPNDETRIDCYLKLIDFLRARAMEKYNENTGRLNQQ